MKIDASVFNTLQRAYQAQLSLDVAARTNSNTFSALTETDEVIFSPEGYSKSLEPLVTPGISVQSDNSPHDPLPDAPDKLGSSGGNP